MENVEETKESPFSSRQYTANERVKYKTKATTLWVTTGLMETLLAPA